MALKSYGAIVFDDSKNVWKIISAEPHVCIKLKNTFQKINKASVLPFEFPHTPENCHDLLWFMDRYTLSISPENKKRMQRARKAYIDLQEQLERILAPDYIGQEVELKEPWKARQYQLQAKELHEIQKNFLLGDDIGLGKTLTGTITFNKKTLPALVVVQTHMKSHWKEKVELYSNLKVHVIKVTKPYTLPKADVYVMSYSCLSGWVDFFQTGFFKSVIFDEIQELRVAGSQKYQAAEGLIYSLQYTLGMSATPIFNYGDEIFNIMHLLKPGCLGSREDFLREWCVRDGNHWVVEDTKALGTYLREQNLFLRRTRAEVGRELPPVNKIIHEVGYDSAEVKKADQIARELAIKATTGSFMERGQAARELDAYVRHKTGIAKAKEVAEFVKLLLHSEAKIILAGWHRDVYDVWLKELAAFKPVMYTGSESASQKDAAKKAFVDEDARIMLMSLRSGVGLDGLQKVCKCVVLGELDWSPQVHNQLIGRVDREGQEWNVTAFFCITDYGTDPIMLDILGLKADQAEGIIDPLQGTKVQLSDDSHLKKLAQSFLNKEPATLFDE